MHAAPVDGRTSGQRPADGFRRSCGARARPQLLRPGGQGADRLPSLQQRHPCAHRRAKEPLGLRVQGERHIAEPNGCVCGSASDTLPLAPASSLSSPGSACMQYVCSCVSGPQALRNGSPIDHDWLLRDSAASLEPADAADEGGPTRPAPLFRFSTAPAPAPLSDGSAAGTQALSSSLQSDCAAPPPRAPTSRAAVAACGLSASGCASHQSCRWTAGSSAAGCAPVCGCVWAAAPMRTAPSVARLLSDLACAPLPELADLLEALTGGAEEDEEEDVETGSSSNSSRSGSSGGDEEPGTSVQGLLLEQVRAGMGRVPEGRMPDGRAPEGRAPEPSCATRASAHAGRPSRCLAVSHLPVPMDGPRAPRCGPPRCVRACRPRCASTSWPRCQAAPRTSGSTCRRARCWACGAGRAAGSGESAVASRPGPRRAPVQPRRCSRRLPSSSPLFAPVHVPPRPHPAPPSRPQRVSTSAAGRVAAAVPLRRAGGRLRPGAAGVAAEGRGGGRRGAGQAGGRGGWRAWVGVGVRG